MVESLLNTPILWINKYLEEKIIELTGLGDVPFFPSSPNTINDLTQSFPAGGVMATWDRLIRMRRGPFPHIKQEQALYYFYATADNTAENMVKIQEAVLRLMDRGDESAEELNEWSRSKTFGGMSNRFLFHNFKIYQLEETRDIIDFGTARTYGGNKIIIDYTYHQVGQDGKALES